MRLKDLFKKPKSYFEEGSTVYTKVYPKFDKGIFTDPILHEWTRLPRFAQGRSNKNFSCGFVSAGLYFAKVWWTDSQNWGVCSFPVDTCANNSLEYGIKPSGDAKWEGGPAHSFQLVCTDLVPQLFVFLCSWLIAIRSCRSNFVTCRAQKKVELLHLPVIILQIDGALLRS